MNEKLKLSESCCAELKSIHESVLKEKNLGFENIKKENHNLKNQMKEVELSFEMKIKDLGNSYNKQIQTERDNFEAACKDA